jgi:hypothetical protein
MGEIAGLSLVRGAAFASLRRMFRNILLVVFAAASSFAAERSFDFSEFREHETPAGFRSAVTGRGQPGDWRIRMVEVPPVVAPFSTKSPVVTQRGVLGQFSAERNENRAPLFIFEGDVFKDFTFKTRFKIVSGEVEQMAGVAFRLQDERNYYYIRANAKDQNVAFFRYVDGELIGPVSVQAEVKKGEWNQLVVECRGSKLRALLNDKETIPWTEPNLIPFPDGTSKGVFPMGKVGFWTKADSIAYFTEARIEFTPREAFAQTLVRDTMKAHPRLLGLKIFGLATNQHGTAVIGSSDEKDLGAPGDKVERLCIEKGGSYFGKGTDAVLVTQPLRDRNGETVGAVQLSMTTFFGQTEKNALARALPIVKSIEGRVSSAKDLVQ